MNEILNPVPDQDLATLNLTRFYLIHGTLEFYDAIHHDGVQNPLILTIDPYWGNSMVSPSRELYEGYCRRDITNDEFIKQYSGYLFSSFQEYTSDWLTLISSQRNVILYCGCHRYLDTNLCSGETLGQILIGIMRQLNYRGEFVYALDPCKHTLHT